MRNNSLAMMTMKIGIEWNRQKDGLPVLNLDEQRPTSLQYFDWEAFPDKCGFVQCTIECFPSQLPRFCSICASVPS